MRHPLRNLSILVFAVVLCFACRKEAFTGSKDAILTTSTDTLQFDTVFTRTGSTSQWVKIFNNNAEGIHVSTIQLAGGSASPFRINVNGRPGPLVNTIDISGGDSAYVFVTVSINPTASGLPFLVSDSIEMDYNGNRQWVQLRAYGRNAHFFHNRIIQTNEVWTNDLPYVITGSLVVDSSASLTIEKGCQVYIHADAPFIVDGSLRVNGGTEDSARVLFTGDRLDEPYRDFPASFPGLVFSATSRNNSIRYASIRNAYQGIRLSGLSAGTKLNLEESDIDNALDAGLTSNNSTATLTNVLISNCGKDVVLTGGTYTFTHCTLTAYSNNLVTHKNPILEISNTDNSGTYDVNASLTNCIIWGESGNMVTDEAVINRQGNSMFQVSFNRVLLRNQHEPANCNITGLLLNQDPLFDSVNTFRQWYSFRLKPGSPAIDNGISTPTSVDLDGKPRPVGLPDLGAYERQ